MSTELLALRELSKYYTATNSVAVGLDKVSLTFRRGEFVAITGESGSGKSTMAHVMAGILPYEGGELLFRGKPTSHYAAADWEDYRRNAVSFISQSYGILPGNTVLSNVTTALRLAGMDRDTALRRAEGALRQVELWDLRHRRAAKLSSGQKQRLSIARALARPAPILIADEPTGNLDAENSAKIIELLAQAARDRLVILITHEFSEAEDYATRHILLHDGHVTMDRELRPPYRPTEAAVHTPRRSKKGLSLTVAGLQLRSRPVWTVLMTLLFTLTVFAVFALAGTFLASLDDTPTRIYDPSAFRNGSDRRIVVVRPGGEDFTDRDYDALLGVEFVQEVEPWGYISDIKYAWRENVDYYITSQLTSSGGTDPVFAANPLIRLELGAMAYAQTVPALPAEQTFLTAGRLPEDTYEVVAVGGEELLGQTLPVYLTDVKNWSLQAYLKLQVTVVGVTDYGSGLYFHDDVGRMSLLNAYDAGFLLWADTYFLKFDGMQKPRVGIDQDYPLVAGRRPENVNEVIVFGREELLGTTIPMTFHTTDNGRAVARDMLVVGVVDRWDLDRQGTYLFYKWAIDELLLSDPQIVRYEEEIARRREEFAAGLAQLALQLEEGADLPKEEYLALQAAYKELSDEHFRFERSLNKYESDTLLVEVPLFDGQLLLTAGQYNLASQRNNGRALFAYTLSTEDGEPYIPLCVGKHSSTYSRVFTVNRADYDRLAYHGGSRQVSVTIEDYAYTDRVLNAIHALGYGAVSPYRECSTTQDPVLAEQRMQTLRICLIALVAALVLQVVVLRAMFSLENESYRLLCNIGLDRVTAKRSAFWQVLVFTLCGQSFGVLAILLCGMARVSNVERLLRYLDIPMRLGLCAVHLCACLLTSLWVTHALEKKVYPDPPPAADLDWDDEGEEVEA